MTEQNDVDNMLYEDPPIRCGTFNPDIPRPEPRERPHAIAGMELKRQRKDAGVILGHAAQYAEITPKDLCDIERGHVACPPEVEALLSECYVWECRECGAWADAVQPRRSGLCDACSGEGMTPAAAAVLGAASGRRR